MVLPGAARARPRHATRPPRSAARFAGCHSPAPPGAHASARPFRRQLCCTDSQSPARIPVERCPASRHVARAASSSPIYRFPRGATLGDPLQITASAVRGPGQGRAVHHRPPAETDRRGPAPDAHLGRSVMHVVERCYIRRVVLARLPSSSFRRSRVKHETTRRELYTNLISRPPFRAPPELEYVLTWW